MNNHHLAVRALMIGVIIPLLVTTAAVALMLSWLHELPDPAAVHWGLNGRPDAFGPAIQLPLVLALVALPFSSVIGGVLVLSASRRPLTAIGKFMVVLSLGLAVMLSVALTATVYGQRGLTNAADAPNPAPAFGLGVAIALVLAVAAWFVLPKAASIRRGNGIPKVQPLSLALGERATWLRTAAAPAAFTWLFVGITVLLFGASGLSIAVSGGSLWPLTFLPVVVLLAILGSFTWTIRVDAHGLYLRGILGLPVIRVPLADIASADVVTVDPFGQFGGWGIRFGFGGRLGIILRSGEALQVIRKSGRSIVITVDDAQSAAALLGGLIAREAVSPVKP
ncbi:MAG: hypothetical protein JWQ39_2302 [Glaciihabitans sp.]|jgi:hypothetical protein|nr:hypothetical protein [Glaciihabitans sp.]